MIKHFVASLALLYLLTGQPMAADRSAPDWDVSEWINSDGVSLGDLRGRVVVVEFFQLWCPGCNQFSIPLMEQWRATFAPEIGSDKLALLSIHTVFEGHDHQNPARLREFVREKGIEHPVGIDRHRNGDEIPETMKRFGTRGTPEMAIIDKHGRIRFQRFGGFEPSEAEALIRALLEES